MKDCKLSEAKAICEKANFNCENCEFGYYQWYGNFIACMLQYNPKNWQIDKETKDERLHDN